MRITRGLSLMSVMLVVAASALSGCGLTSSTQDEKKDIVIGADLELTGPAAELGTAFDRALKLKIEQLNESGTLDRKIRYESKNNRSDKNQSLANVTDFTNDPSISAIITGSCSECLQADKPVIKDKHMPTISLSPASSVINPIEQPYIFKLGPNASDDAAALVAELGRDQGDKTTKKKKVGLLVTTDEYGQDGLAAMTNELDAESGFTIAGTEQFKPTEADVRSKVHDVLDSDPDALVIWAYAGQAQQAAQAARAEGFKGELLFDAAAAGSLFQRPDDNTTLIFTQTLVIDDLIATTPAKASRKQWFRDYTARYGSYYGPASFAADAVQLLVDAIQRAGSDDPEQVRTALESTQFDGLTGAIRLTPANHSGLMPQALVALMSTTAGRWRIKI